MKNVGQAEEEFQAQSWTLVERVVEPNQKIAAVSWEFLRRTPIYNSLYKMAYAKTNDRRKKIPFSASNPMIFLEGRWKIVETKSEIAWLRRNIHVAPLLRLVAAGCDPSVIWTKLTPRQKSEITRTVIYPQLVEAQMNLSIGFCKVSKSRGKCKIIPSGSFFIFLPNKLISPELIQLSPAKFVVIQFDPYESEPELVRQLRLLLNGFRQGFNVMTEDATFQKRNFHLGFVTGGAYDSALAWFVLPCSKDQIVKHFQSLIKNRARWLNNIDFGPLSFSSRKKSVQFSDIFLGFDAYDAVQQGMLKKTCMIGNQLFRKTSHNPEWLHHRADYVREILDKVDKFWRIKSVKPLMIN